MKLTYATTVISFCANLTDPHASSIPIASLTIGEVDTDRVAMLVSFPWNFDKMKLHSLTQEILKSADDSIKSQVDRLMDVKPHISIESFVKELHHGFRNSLHVSHIQEPQSFELPHIDALSTQVETQSRMLSASISELIRALNNSDMENAPFLTQESFPQVSEPLTREKSTFQTTTNDNSLLNLHPAHTRPHMYPNQSWPLAPRTQA